MYHLIFFLLLANTLFASAPANLSENTYLPANHIIEQVILWPAKAKGLQDLGPDWPDAEQRTLGSGILLQVYAFSPSAVETYYGTWHPLHHTTRSGQCYFDLHYKMNSADTGTVRMTASFWTCHPGTDLAALGAATATTSWTIDPRDTAAYDDANFYAIAYSGTVNGGQMGQINIADLGLTSIQDEVIYMLRRDATDGTNDTHTGDLDLIRLEAHYAVYGQILSIGE